VAIVVASSVEEILPERPDDASAEGFARQLGALKRRIARRKPRPATFATADWKLDYVDPGAPEEWKVSAAPEGYLLLTFKMKESFMATQPLYMPRITWSVYRANNRLVMGGQAPSLAVGQARAEAIWCVEANVCADA
jgi:hypothetical protein